MKVFFFRSDVEGEDPADKAVKAGKQPGSRERIRRLSEDGGNEDVGCFHAEYVDRMNAEAGSLLDKLSRRASFEKETLAKLKADNPFRAVIEHLRQTDPASIPEGEADGSGTGCIRTAAKAMQDEGGCGTVENEQAVVQHGGGQRNRQ